MQSRSRRLYLREASLAAPAAGLLGAADPPGHEGANGPAQGALMFHRATRSCVALR
jgi:hypothetical protein